MKGLLVLLSFLAISNAGHGQNATDWTWYSQPLFDYRVVGLCQDAAGNIWMASGTYIIKYDGVNWVAFDVLDSGLSIEHAQPVSIDVSLGDRIWISTRDRVVEYDLINNLWTVHDPSGNAVNFNASRIKVEAANRIWWATGSRVWEYNGSVWKPYNLHQSGIHINANSLSDIQIDKGGRKWMTTPSSICIEGGCFTPAGLVSLSDADTTLIDGINFGFPKASFTQVALDSNDDPLLVTNGNDTLGNFFMRYINGQWTTPVDIPYEGWIYGVVLGQSDELYLSFKNFIAIGRNGTWDVIPLDSSKIDITESMLLTPGNDLYIGGRDRKSGQTELGALGKLPYLNFRTRGLLYSDKNSNGVFDNADIPLRNHYVQTEDQDRISFSNEDGNYSLLFSAEGTYTVEGILPIYHSYGNPVDGKYTTTLSVANPTSANNDIGYIPDTTAIDLAISLTGSNGANPGFTTCYVASIKNLAPRLTDTDVTLVFDDRLTFVSSDVTPSSINGNTLTYHLDAMEWMEIRNIRACFLLPPDPVLLGDTLRHSASVTPVGGPDLDLQNNVYTLSQIVRGSFDPNFLEVKPSGIGETGDIPSTTTRLEYTIHFQNVGNDTARNIAISNPVDEYLDLSTLQVLGSSHPYEMSFIEEGRVLRWTFDHINLPDSTANRALSNGFIKYTLDLTSHAAGMKYTNQADIYFDFNPPVTTNETINTITDAETSIFGIPDDQDCGILWSGIDGHLALYFPQEDEYHIGLYDLSGRKCFSTKVASTELNLDLGNLPSGCYLLSVVSSGCYQSLKVFLK